LPYSSLGKHLLSMTNNSTMLLSTSSLSYLSKKKKKTFTFIISKTSTLWNIETLGFQVKVLHQVSLKVAFHHVPLSIWLKMLIRMVPLQISIKISPLMLKSSLKNRFSLLDSTSVVSEISYLTLLQLSAVVEQSVIIPNLLFPFIEEEI
jgi:hypothetical protein